MDYALDLEPEYFNTLRMGFVYPKRLGLYILCGSSGSCLEQMLGVCLIGCAERIN